jgi:2-succinyl-5-enolpyruvyl-6-hydroxy-3-cyclohexene-1-carboxylate synthase
MHREISEPDVIVITNNDGGGLSKHLKTEAYTDTYSYRIDRRKLN